MERRGASRSEEASLSSVLTRLVPAIGTGQLHDEWFASSLFILIATHQYTPPLLLDATPADPQLWDPTLVAHPGFDQHGFLSRVRGHPIGVTVMLELQAWPGCSRSVAGQNVTDSLCEMLTHYIGAGTFFLSAHVSPTSFEATGQLEAVTIPLLTQNGTSRLSLIEAGTMVRIGVDRTAAGLYGIVALQTDRGPVTFGAELTGSLSHLHLTASSREPWYIGPRITIASAVLSVGFQWQVGLSSLAMASHIVIGDVALCAPLINSTLNAAEAAQVTGGSACIVAVGIVGVSTTSIGDNWAAAGLGEVSFQSVLDAVIGDDIVDLPHWASQVGFFVPPAQEHALWISVCPTLGGCEVHPPGCSSAVTSSDCAPLFVAPSGLRIQGGLAALGMQGATRAEISTDGLVLEADLGIVNVMDGTLLLSGTGALSGPRLGIHARLSPPSFEAYIDARVVVLYLQAATRVKIAEEGFLFQLDAMCCSPREPSCTPPPLGPVASRR